ncbi:hypothetical protein BLA29_013042 [Euroglyphus maynei]|uniref:Uncharacterized protein n=1 Tax=Euroglyphus maynei TaxID=6958 RepID=A0A1Y3AV58_EURMA|nr:hypothetical protein BLA29_013042 [Euroglyphus maynei]
MAAVAAAQDWHLAAKQMIIQHSYAKLLQQQQQRSMNTMIENGKTSLSPTTIHQQQYQWNNIKEAMAAVALATNPIIIIHHHQQQQTVQ